MHCLRFLGLSVAVASASVWALPAGPVHAHFKLMKPASWVNEDGLGGPQKGAPCGPGGDDDVQPMPASDQVLTAHAGETIQVEIQETIYHAGYFRVALAEDRSQFKDPPLTDPVACTLDLNSVMTGPHDNVLVDGMGKTDVGLGTNRHMMQDVKLPDKPCDKCTLQVLQVMKDHGPPNCFYYHCANIKILPASDTAAAGSGSTAGSSGGASTGGSSASASGAGGSSGGASGAGGSVSVGASASAGSGGSSSVSSSSSSTAGATGSKVASAGSSGGATSTASTGRGTGGSPGQTTSAANASAGTTATPAADSGSAPANSSGCAVTAGTRSGSANLGFMVLGTAFALRALRRRTRR